MAISSTAPKKTQEAGNMGADAWNIALNVIASAITGSVVWLAGRLWRLRSLRRKQLFFGLDSGADCLLTVPRHASSPRENSMHRTDAAALLELAGVIESCGARAEVIFHDQTYQGPGGKTEFCFGGPEANHRTEAHLRSALPGVRFALYEAENPQPPATTVGTETYQADSGKLEYAVLAKITRAAHRPVFLIGGQTSTANRAAGRFLISHYRDLAGTHGPSGRFCVVLRVVEPGVYGPSVVELVRDATTEAFSARTAADPPRDVPSS
jgi:hypothetical protein